MTRQSERELKRAVEDLQREVGVDPDGPTEIIISETVVKTPWGDYDGEPVCQTRLWQDETGEWHTEEVDPDEVPPERRPDR